MQGYTLFMLYVVRQPEARNVWTSTFRRTTDGVRSSFLSSSFAASPARTRRSQPSAGNYGKPIDSSRLNNNAGDTINRVSKLSVRVLPAGKPVVLAGNLNPRLNNEDGDSGID